MPSSCEALQVSSVLGGVWRVTAKIESTALREVYAGVGPSGAVCIKVWRGPDAEARVARLREVSRLLPQASLAQWRWDGRIGPARIAVEDWVSAPWAASPAPREQVVTFLDRALEVLSACHEAGVVHGGLAPWRIGRRSERLCIRGFDRAMLGDARALRALAPPWSAPEQVEHGRLGPRADVFSIGVVALFLMAGRAPAADRGALELAQASLRDSEWSSFFETALANNPDERWPSAAAMRRALRAIAGDKVRGTVFAPDAPRAEALPFDERRAGTGTVFAAAAPAEQALPFDTPGAKKPAGTGTVLGASAPRVDALPFGSAAPVVAQPQVKAADPALGTVFGVAAPVVPQAALPFREAPVAPPPAAVAERAQPATGTVFGARAPGTSTLPFTGADAHAQKLAGDERAKLPLERYAAVRTALWRNPERTDEILAREGLDRIAWHCYEGRTLRAAKSRENLARLFDAMREAAKKR